MPGVIESPEHLQSCYWTCSINGHCLWQRTISTAGITPMLRNHMKYFMLCKINSAQRGFTNCCSADVDISDRLTRLFLQCCMIETEQGFSLSTSTFSLTAIHVHAFHSVRFYKGMVALQPPEQNFILWVYFYVSLIVSALEVPRDLSSLTSRRPF